MIIIMTINKYPDNYKYISPKFRGYVDCILTSPDSRPLIEKMCDRTPHEMLHHILPRSVAVEERYAGWYEEGLASYISILCKEDMGLVNVKEERKEALDAFLSEGIRSELWTWHGIYNKEMKYPGNSKDEIDMYWKKIDDGYRASLGAFLYYERAIGRKRLFETVKTILNCGFNNQNEAFYKKLEATTGVNIRHPSNSVTNRMCPYIQDKQEPPCP